MKKLILTISVLLCLGFTPVMALTTQEKMIAARTLAEHAQGLIAKQKQELDDTKAKLVWVDKELKDTQPKIDQLGKERDQWKGLYDKDHEDKMKAEKRVLQLYIALGLLVLAISVYAFLKFYMRLPI